MERKQSKHPVVIQFGREDAHPVPKCSGRNGLYKSTPHCGREVL
jgi:hypothetical protein